MKSKFAQWLPSPVVLSTTDSPELVQVLQALHSGLSLVLRIRLAELGEGELNRPLSTDLSAPLLAQPALKSGLGGVGQVLTPSKSVHNWP